MYQYFIIFLQVLQKGGDNLKDLKKYNAEYQQKNIVRKVIKFNKQNQTDLILLDWISLQDNWSNYCKHLIQTDMQEHQTKE